MRVLMNRGFRVRLSDRSLDAWSAGVVLDETIDILINAPLLNKHGASLLEPLSRQSTGIDAFDDMTSYEALTNKLHVEDFVECGAADPPEVTNAHVFQQGIKAALQLAHRLERGSGRFRIIASIEHGNTTSPASMTLRFFQRREGEPWGDENPNAYPQEDVLYIDVGD